MDVPRIEIVDEIPEQVEGYPEGSMTAALVTIGWLLACLIASVITVIQFVK